MAYQVDAGELRTKVTFQSPTVSQGNDGAQVPTWSNVTSNPTVWARWVDAHGQEAMTGDALKSVQRAVVTIRHRSDIVTSWRVKRVSDSTYWQIISVDLVQGRNRYIEMVVERAKGTV